LGLWLGRLMGLDISFSFVIVFIIWVLSVYYLKHRVPFMRG
jgi:hypothetical protein